MYTYAFLLDSECPNALPQGIAGALQLMGTGELVALVEPHLEWAQVQENDDRLMQAVLTHDRVVRYMFSQATVLPLRFGTYFVSDRGLLNHLDERKPEYLNKLKTLHGKAEYTLKLKPLPLLETGPIDAAVTGREYFLAKKQQYQSQQQRHAQQQAQRQRILHLLTDTYPNWVWGEPQEGLERLYLLSDRREEARLQAAYQHWQLQAPLWEMSLGEALPPYHFV